MNLIKKMFPKHESKAELTSRLEKEIAFYKGMNQPKVNYSDHNIDTVRTCVEMGDRLVPVDILKREIKRKLVDILDDYIKYDICDASNGYNKLLYGTLSVVLKK